MSWGRWWQDGPWEEGLGTSKGAGVLQGAVWDVGWVGYAVGLDFLVVFRSLNNHYGPTITMGLPLHSFEPTIERRTGD